MTAPLRWPNVHKDARDKAAEEAIKGIRALTPIVNEERPMTENERYRRETQALLCLKNIARMMAEAGAPIRAIDEL